MTGSSHADRVDRRRYQRLEIAEAPSALLGGHDVRMIDLSLRGAGIEHEMPFSTGRAATLEFSVAGESVRVSAQIVRCRLARRENGRVFYRSGLAFPAEDAAGLLQIRQVMVALIARERDSERERRARRSGSAASA